MLFGMKVKVEKSQQRAKAYLSSGVLCMLLSLFFHVTQAAFQSDMTGLQQGSAVNLTVDAWQRTASTLSFVCLWIAVLMLFQATFQHRKMLQSAGL